MTDVRSIGRSTFVRRVVPIFFAVALGVGAASCGSSAGNGGTGSQQHTPTSTPKTGGAGF
jgi:hypothetical protein